MWEDEKRVELPVNFTSEPRRIVTALLYGKHWSAVITVRGERIRIISVRRAREDEKEAYESDIGKKEDKTCNG
ncbi:MAG: BrnT family toxin [bacterium]